MAEGSVSTSDLPLYVLDGLFDIVLMIMFETTVE